jgi:hypothetical protein
MRARPSRQTRTDLPARDVSAGDCQIPSVAPGSCPKVRSDQSAPSICVCSLIYSGCLHVESSNGGVFRLHEAGSARAVRTTPGIAHALIDRSAFNGHIISRLQAGPMRPEALG